MADAREDPIPLALAHHAAPSAILYFLSFFSMSLTLLLSSSSLSGTLLSGPLSACSSPPAKTSYRITDHLTQSYSKLALVASKCVCVLCWWPHQRPRLQWRSFPAVWRVQDSGLDSQWCQHCLVPCPWLHQPCRTCCDCADKQFLPFSVPFPFVNSLTAWVRFVIHYVAVCLYLARAKCENAMFNASLSGKYSHGSLLM